MVTFRTKGGGGAEGVERGRDSVVTFRTKRGQLGGVERDRDSGVPHL